MIDANRPQKLMLAAHVRACECDGNIILFDLQCNRYLGVDGAVSQALSACVDNWPSTTPTVYSSPDASATRDLIHKLRSRGLLVAASPVRHTDMGANCLLEEAASTIDLDGGIAAPPAAARRALQTLQFTYSLATAACSLRCRSLQAIASTIARRRTRIRGPRAESLEAMRPVVAAYEALRPLVFTARAQCLLDSLALVGFLAHARFLPRWVVGVRTGPFSAHSWVQIGDTVLNDQHEYVRQFRPILVV